MGALKLVKSRIVRVLMPKPKDPIWKEIGNALLPFGNSCKGNSSVLSNVRARLLKCPWSSATAGGRKFFECVVNCSTHQNVLKSFQDGHYMAFGEKGTNKVDGVAVVEGEPHLQCSDRSLLKSLFLGSKDEIAQLDEYLDRGQTFDYLMFREVFDLRPKKLSWNEFCRRLRCSSPGQWQGFPSLQGSEVVDKLQNMLAEAGVLCHSRPCVSDASPQHVSKDRGNYEKAHDVMGTEAQVVLQPPLVTLRMHREKQKLAYWSVTIKASSTMSTWGQMMAQAQKKEKDPVEARKLAKRLYCALRRKAMSGTGSIVTKTNKKAKATPTKATAMKVTKAALKAKIEKTTEATKPIKVAKKPAVKAATKSATAAATPGLWSKAVASAKKKEKDAVEMRKLAKRLYVAMRNRAATSM